MLLTSAAGVGVRKTAQAMYACGNHHPLQGRLGAGLCVVGGVLKVGDCLIVEKLSAIERGLHERISPGDGGLVGVLGVRLGRLVGGSRDLIRLLLGRDEYAISRARSDGSFKAGNEVFLPM